jgi:hypothetical protein
MTKIKISIKYLLFSIYHNRLKNPEVSHSCLHICLFNVREQLKSVVCGQVSSCWGIILACNYDIVIEFESGLHQIRWSQNFSIKSDKSPT